MGDRSGLEYPYEETSALINLLVKLGVLKKVHYEMSVDMESSEATHWTLTNIKLQ